MQTKQSANDITIASAMMDATLHGVTKYDGEVVNNLRQAMMQVPGEASIDIMLEDIRQSTW